MKTWYFRCFFFPPKFYDFAKTLNFPVRRGRKIKREDGGWGTKDFSILLDCSVYGLTLSPTGGKRRKVEKKEFHHLDRGLA